MVECGNRQVLVLKRIAKKRTELRKMDDRACVEALKSGIYSNPTSIIVKGVDVLTD